MGSNELISKHEHTPGESEASLQTPEVGQALLPDRLISTKDLFGIVKEGGASIIYEWYEDAMRRRDREPLDENRFFRHFFEGGSLESTCAFGDAERGLLLGLWKRGIFIPTHFAPKTLRGGYKMFQELARSKEIPVVSAVSEDIAETLKKMDGWKVLKLPLLSNFNSDLMKKVLVYNSYPGIRRKMLPLVKDFILESKTWKFWERSKKQENEQDDSTDDLSSD